MQSAAEAREDRRATRLLVLDPLAPFARCSRRLADARIDELPRYVRAGDVLVLNDAATLPASLRALTASGAEVELRLSGPLDGTTATAVVFGAGDYHTRTEDRPPPPELHVGERIRLGARLDAQVEAISPLSARLLELRFEQTAAPLWAALYAHGAPVQYSHQCHDLPLWAVQTAYAARPWAAEMPSAGRPLTLALLLALRRAGTSVATLTHAAGLSATGDPALDAALPLPERYELPEATARIVEHAKARGGRVIAVGTTVVRALEGAAHSGGGTLKAGNGVTDLHIGPGFEPRYVSGILTGMHSPGESHFELLHAFANADQLRAGFEYAEASGYLGHEFGDLSLILPGALVRAASAEPRERAQCTLGTLQSLESTRALRTHD
jgi:S-adenosylmethionine:tRNA ribosyltransferase-isomerase